MLAREELHRVPDNLLRRWNRTSQTVGSRRTPTPIVRISMPIISSGNFDPLLDEDTVARQGTVFPSVLFHDFSDSRWATQDIESGPILNRRNECTSSRDRALSLASGGDAIVFLTFGS